MHQSILNSSTPAPWHTEFCILTPTLPDLFTTRLVGTATTTMGNTISSIIDQQEADAEAQARDALNALEELAKSRLDLWYATVV